MPNLLEILIQNLKKVNLELAVHNVIKANERQVVELITQAQIYKKGITGTGAKIKSGKYQTYSPAYTAKKERKGLYQGYVDLHYTGEWLDSWGIKFDIDGFTIQPGQSQEDLTMRLVSLYGSDIELLTDENRQNLFILVAENLRDEILKQIKIEA